MGLPHLQAHLLYNRGLQDRQDAERYLAADYRLHNDPWLLPDIEKAVDRILQALRRGERIGVFGDYDADGITGTALLTRALGRLGGRVVPYVPHRVEEGHGLSARAVEHMRRAGVGLLVTVDCGVASRREIELAASHGIDTVVTDHHVITGHLPPAVAVVDPHRPDSRYPFGGLTGVGLAFKLAEALYEAMGRPWPEDLLELVALGTVADSGPLVGENRYLVKAGLRVLNATHHPGLRALAQQAGLVLGGLDSEALAFGLIPRINAAGRMAHPSLSLDLLLCEDDQQARAITQRLERWNRQRQSSTEKAMVQALRQLRAKDQAERPPAALVVAHREWSPGIVGLVAAKLCERFYRPTVAVAKGPEVSVASARSIPEVSIVGALERIAHLFLRFGGHPRAAGFSMDTRHLPRLEEELVQVVAEEVRGQELVPSIHVDCQADLDHVDRGIADFIEGLEPFGEANPKPVFFTRGAAVVNAYQVGQTGDHLKLRLYHQGRYIDAIAFRQGPLARWAQGKVDLVYEVGVNRWQGRESVELTVLDFRPAEGTAPSARLL